MKKSLKVMLAVGSVLLVTAISAWASAASCCGSGCCGSGCC